MTSSRKRTSRQHATRVRSVAFYATLICCSSSGASTTWQSSPQHGRKVPFFHDISFEPRNTVLSYDSDRFRDRRHLSNLDRSATEDIVFEDDDIKHSQQDIIYDNDDEVDDRYRSIRIHFVTDMLESMRGQSDKVDAQIDDIINIALPDASRKWAQHLYVKPVRSVIDVSNNTCHGVLGDQLPRKEVFGADLVVIVAAQSKFFDEVGDAYTVCEDRTLAIGSACELDQFDRPVVGFINFCLDSTPPDASLQSYIQSSFSRWLDVELEPNELHTPSTTDIVKHELAHVLAFSPWLLKFFRNPDGTPRTPRPFISETRTCTDDTTQTAQFPSRNTVATTLNSNGDRILHLVTPRVVQVARNHLQCNSVPGARLEGDCLGAHFHERVFLGELMSPSLSSSDENVLSPLTLALMEDSGWYRVDYRDVEIPIFGLGAGCEFAKDACISNGEVPQYSQGMFCDLALRFDDGGLLDVESMNSVICNPSHTQWSLCDLWDSMTVPEGLTDFPEAQIRYFDNANLVSSFSLAESCPIPAKSLGLDCTAEDIVYPTFYWGESVGSDSRCINAYTVVDNTVSRRPACMRLICDAESNKVMIDARDGDPWICEYDGQVLDKKGASFECPRFAAVCPQLSACPSSCSGRGECVFDNGVYCLCEEGSGAGCYPSIDPRNEVVNTTPVVRPSTSIVDVPESSNDAVTDDFVNASSRVNKTEIAVGANNDTSGGSGGVPKSIEIPATSDGNIGVTPTSTHLLMIMAITYALM